MTQNEGDELIDGDENVTMYHLYYHGGSYDGKQVNSFRPYDSMQINSEIYKATEGGDDCLVWENDYTFGIDLYFTGYGKLEDY